MCRLALTAFVAGVLAVARAWGGTGVEVGADVSMLPALEAAGATYRDEGRDEDAVAILRRRGAALFRVRVFVEPGKDFNRLWGAVQTREEMVALGRRIKSAGGKLIVDLHYSDTWADPQHQARPKSWEGLSGAALEERVEQYTAETLAAFTAGGAAADYVQVGNEVTGGMLWPDGQLRHDGTGGGNGVGNGVEKAASWERLGRLVWAGVRGVRRQGGTEGPKVIVHIHGGGKLGLPGWFFGKLGKELAKHNTDFDVIGLSFYPAFGDRLEALAENLRQLEPMGKPVMVVETSYPWRPLEGVTDPAAMRWEQSEAGQAAYLRALLGALGGHEGAVAGVVWWYPEARPVGGLEIWRGGAEGLFDGEGRLLRAGREWGR